MSGFNFEILSFNPKEASNNTLESYFSLLDERFLEISEDEKLPSKETRLIEIQKDEPDLSKSYWLVKTEQKAIGYGILTLLNADHLNYSKYKHVAGIRMYILKNFRRKGYGTALLRAFTKNFESNTVITKLHTIAFMESGKSFCEKYDGILTQKSVGIRLKFDDVDWELMTAWRKNGKQLSEETGVKIVTYDKIPDDLLDEFCDLYTVLINQSPRGELFELTITPITHQQQEQQMQKRGGSYNYKITREADGTISGITIINYDPFYQDRIGQIFTGVKEEYRRKGKAKWLKADMLFFIRDNFPKTRFIGSGNAELNAAMLSINERMGFKQISQLWWFDFNLEDVRAKLDY